MSRDLQSAAAEAADQDRVQKQEQSVTSCLTAVLSKTA